MTTVRDWLRHRFSRSFARQTAHTSGSGQSARTSRADRITELQATISSLQQDRVALSQAPREASGTGTDEASDKPMIALERELDDAQRELATIQGRI